MPGFVFRPADSIWICRDERKLSLALSVLGIIYKSSISSGRGCSGWGLALLITYFYMSSGIVLSDTAACL
jgi:hypothetical protein